MIASCTGGSGSTSDGSSGPDGTTGSATTTGSSGPSQVDTSTGSDPDGTASSEDTGPEPQQASSVSQYGITWTFDGTYPVGQYVTGDWWVVGPVTIESVSPDPTDGRNGSMLDPVGSQDYDDRAGNHEAGLRVSFPLTVEGTHSLVSSISHPEEPECTNGSSDAWLTYDGDCQRGPIHTQAILTIVDQAPPADAFRPPYAGPDKPSHRASDVCWDALPKLAGPAELPDAEALLRHVERPWVDHLGSWVMQHGCATHNMYCYGREIGNIVAQLATYVLLDTPQQQTLAIRLIQLGIDNHGVLQAGGGWPGDGGHFNGRKLPIVLAGSLLGDAAMASPGLDVGNEDRMTYYGSDGIARWGRDCDSCYFASGCDYAGACMNGAKDCRDPAGLEDGCADYRNCCTSVTWVGEALAVHAMGQRQAWGHDAFFDYVDRWVAGDVDGGGGASSDFVLEMWSMYRDAAPTVGGCR